LYQRTSFGKEIGLFNSYNYPLKLVNDAEYSTCNRKEFNTKYRYEILLAVFLYINFYTESQLKYLIPDGDIIIVKNDVINKFSKLLRNILINSQESLIPLREDIEILKVYLALEEINHSNSFSWTLELDESLLTNSFYTPPMLIQPIVENAIKYGVYENDGLISIRYFLKGDNIEIEVRDNGKPISTIKDNQLINEGTGTKLIKERLDLFNHNNKLKSTINFHNLSPKGNLVKITIPIQK
jgi:sensor histidine kinase YesM